MAPVTTVEHGPGNCSSAVARVLRAVEQLHVPYGREDSFKLTAGQFIGGRVLVGMHAGDISPASFFQLGEELAMPAGCRELLEAQWSDANAMLVGIEDRPAGTVCKFYLEFWERVRRIVRQSGDRTPRLLHLGVKWDTGRPGRFDVARYVCHPMLGFSEICRRMAQVYPAGASEAAREDALAIVRFSARRNPAASMLYLEVSEEANARCSFDVNLYKTGMTVGDAAGLLQRAASNLGVAPDALAPELRRLAQCPFGHVAGGIDRHGNEFLSVYAEVRHW